MEYIITSDNYTLAEYKKYYFKKYPRRKIFPIKTCLHPSINTWFILTRKAMNKLKQDWKEYMIWLVDKNNMRGLNIKTCELIYEFYKPTKRRFDCDNHTPKFTNDGLVEANVIVDDDYLHCNPLTIYCSYDKENPRMEIHILEGLKC